MIEKLNLQDCHLCICIYIYYWIRIFGIAILFFCILKDFLNFGIVKNICQIPAVSKNRKSNFAVKGTLFFSNPEISELGNLDWKIVILLFFSILKNNISSLIPKFHITYDLCRQIVNGQFYIVKQYKNPLFYYLNTVGKLIIYNMFLCSS